MANTRVPLVARPLGVRVGKPTSRRGDCSGFSNPIIRARPVAMSSSAPPGTLADMQVTLVSVSVIQGDEEDFASESIANAFASVEEMDNDRFDVLRSTEDPGKFLLVEIYKTPNGPVAHKSTEHYAAWRENVEDMMAEPRSTRKFTPMYPWPGLWGTSAASRRQEVEEEDANEQSNETNLSADCPETENMASTFLTLDSENADAESLTKANTGDGHIDDFLNMIDGMADTKVITHVHVTCVSGTEDEFAEASMANAASSVLEPGNLRFDVLRDKDEPNKFLLIEVYDNSNSAAAHKQTPHYLEWRQTVQEMMAEPRQAYTYVARFPEEEKAWKMTLSDV